jgi:hypothetical protein
VILVSSKLFFFGFTELPKHPQEIKARKTKKTGGGRNVYDQNVDRPKISERRNGLFSWSERRNQNVENVFW